MQDNLRDTQQFEISREKRSAKDTLKSVYEAMREKGYDPVNQIVGYLLSGDPTYITSYNNARYLISRIERDELLEELVARTWKGNSVTDAEILAFDIGERRIGVAVSDPLGITAQGIETYTRTDDLQKDVEHLLNLANGYKPVKLVFACRATWTAATACRRITPRICRRSAQRLGRGFRVLGRAPYHRQRAARPHRSGCAARKAQRRDRQGRRRADSAKLFGRKRQYLIFNIRGTPSHQRRHGRAGKEKIWKNKALS